MKREAFFESNGIHYDWGTNQYSGTEKIIGREFWVCSYCPSKTPCRKSVRNVPPVLVRILPVHESRKKETYHGFYDMPVFARKVKNGVPTGPEIGLAGNSTGDSDLHFFENEEECREHYAKQLSEASHKVKELMAECEDKLAELDALRIKHCV